MGDSTDNIPENKENAIQSSGDTPTCSSEIDDEKSRNKKSPVDSKVISLPLYEQQQNYTYQPATATTRTPRYEQRYAEEGAANDDQRQGFGNVFQSRGGDGGGGRGRGGLFAGNISPEEQYIVRFLFDDRSIRQKFVQRVYTILSLQLLLTFGFVCVSVFVTAVKIWIRSHIWVFYLAFAGFFIVYLVLICVPSSRKVVPTNLFLLGLLTVCMAYLCGSISISYDSYMVLGALGITAFICTLVSIFAIQTKWDITECGVCLCCMSIIFMILIIVSMIIGFFVYIPVLDLVISCVGALLFTAFLMYDTQQVVGGRRFQISPEEYVYGALTLYIDIVYIFIYIMGIMSGGRR